MKGQIVGILLAAGLSRRFGADKLLHPLADGTAMILASARALRAVLPSVVAVIRPGSAALADLLKNDGIATVVADNADTGMGASLARGIAATRDAAGWLIALGDMPFIRPDSIARVAAALASGAAIAAPRYRGERGHPVGFAARLGDELLGVAGDTGARELLRRHANNLVTFDCDDPGVLADIDTHSDLTGKDFSMTQQLPTRSGGQVLVEALRIHGVDCVFSVPGESFLPELDALHDARESIRLIVCRQEGAAANMAEAYGKLTGTPGICLVTRGPGATHASIGVHTAAQDSTPMILLVGQVGTGVMGREAWQEIDFRRMFGPIAKWATQIDSVERIPEILSRAFHTAVSGRQGPVVVAIPQNVLYQEAVVADLGAYRRVQAHAGAADLLKMREMLVAAARPMVILGGGGWDAQACAQIQSFAENFELPIGTAFRRQDLFDNQHPNYAGDIGIGINPRLAQRIRDADLVLAIGPRLGEATTSEYTLLEVPRPKQTLIHVHAGSEELGRVYQADLMINAGMPGFADALRQLTGPKTIAWRDWTRAARADYLATLKPGPMPGALDLGEIMTWLRGRLPADTIITNGAGNYTSWVHRFYQYRGFRTQLAPASGAMGYGVPAAIAAKLVHPDRTVVCFSGDGCFLMSAQELATVKQYKLPIVFIVVNNGMYGSIRMHQEIHYPGRVYGTALENPDFAALAQAYGLHGQIVERTADFPAAFENALKAGKGALIELRIDPEAITPRTTLSALREQALLRGQ